MVNSFLDDIVTIVNVQDWSRDSIFDTGISYDHDSVWTWEEELSSISLSLLICE